MSGFYVSQTLPQLLAERGWTQQRLADETGIARTDINLFCTGKKRLGLVRAGRIADALGVSLLELGAPDVQAQDPASTTLRDRLAAVEAEAAALNEENGRLDRLVVDLSVRVEALEAAAVSRETR